VILVDTSVWVHFLRGTDHPSRFALRSLIETRDGEVTTTDPAVLELLAGARSEREAEELRTHLLSFKHAPVSGLIDFEHAAAVQRACRSAGETVRSLLDCLIAAIAIRNDAALLQADADFEVVARHTPLRLEPINS
jgi:predicted nucleic acid-binding protein